MSCTSREVISTSLRLTSPAKPMSATRLTRRSSSPMSMTVHPQLEPTAPNSETLRAA
ncbi:MAG: hypothetical protein R2716_03600 [Microthrixaceae bacterium]